MGDKEEEDIFEQRRSNLKVISTCFFFPEKNNEAINKIDYKLCCQIHSSSELPSPTDLYFNLPPQPL